MSGLEDYMKRHYEAESRYLQQDQLRRDIEYANTIFHYVWYIQSRQRNSNTVKQQTLLLPLPDSDYPLPPFKRTNNVLNRNTYLGLNSSKRLRHSQTNKPVRNINQIRHTSPPYITNSSPESQVSPLQSGSRGFHTSDFSDTLCTAEYFPFPVLDYATYRSELPDGMLPALNGIPFVSCLQERKPNDSRDEVTADGSMVKWNNLNI